MQRCAGAWLSLGALRRLCIVYSSHHLSWGHCWPRLCIRGAAAEGLCPYAMAQAQDLGPSKQTYLACPSVCASSEVARRAMHCRCLHFWRLWGSLWVQGP